MLRTGAMKFLALVSASLAFASLIPACGQSAGATSEEPDGEGDVAALTAEQKEAARQKCSEIQPGRAWTAEEFYRMLDAFR